MEEELDSKQKEQRLAEERLRRREAQLAEREIDLLKRELNMMIVQTQGGTPTPKKRKGNFKKKLLKQKEEKNSSVISAPSGKFSGFKLPVHLLRPPKYIHYILSIYYNPLSYKLR